MAKTTFYLSIHQLMDTYLSLLMWLEVSLAEKLPAMKRDTAPLRSVLESIKEYLKVSLTAQ